jgi:hypothetical protein
VAAFAVEEFERFFQVASGLRVDRQDLKRHNDFVHQQLCDLLLMGQANARANGRDVVTLHDLPVTQGLADSMAAFAQIGGRVDLAPILDRLATYAPLELPVDRQAQALLPTVVGGLSLALARTLTLVLPSVVEPRAEHWERAFKVVDLLV